MATLIKNLKNNHSVIFDSGTFDQYCVYVIDPNGNRTAPRDVTYFTDFLNLSKQYPNNKVYTDFVAIYDLTTSGVEQTVLNLIDTIVITYHLKHQVLVEKWFTVVYAGMIAEENKRYSRLKKRIKRLGMHQVLSLGMLPSQAANFSRGKAWTELDTLMNNYQF